MLHFAKLQAQCNGTIITAIHHSCPMASVTIKIFFVQSFISTGLPKFSFSHDSKFSFRFKLITVTGIYIQIGEIYIS
jgi:hypothetical protein